MMIITLKVRARQWMITCGLGWVLISSVLHAAVNSKAKLGGDSASSEASCKHWTGFRGPGANGHAAHVNPPLSWSVKQGKNILWKAQLPKHGMSSPLVWENRLFLTGADDLSRQVYCFNTDTGKLLWTHDVKGIPGSPADGLLPEVLGETGFAAPTATTNGHHVAAVFATGELVCVTLQGERVWAKHLGIPNNAYGHASSLINHGDLLFVQYDQKDSSQLLAFNLASGRPVWQVKRNAISWSSPILVDNQGRAELILTNCKAVDSYDPQSGSHLWQVACLAGEVASSAAYCSGIVFVANEGATATAIDIRNRASEPKILWQWDESLPDAASPLANERYLILPTAFGVVSCLDVKTGKLLWEHEFDDGFYSSPLLVNDRVYMIDLEGRMQIFRMDKEFELLGTAETGEDAYATPALVGDRIYIRGLTHLLCVGERK
jgi:outer membrane protein assembly factor BamB